MDREEALEKFRTFFNHMEEREPLSWTQLLRVMIDFQHEAIEIIYSIRDAVDNEEITENTADGLRLWPQYFFIFAEKHNLSLIDMLSVMGEYQVEVVEKIKLQENEANND